MDNFGDPGWFGHQQIAQLWGLVALRLASSQVVAFNATTYTIELEKYLKSLDTIAKDRLGNDAESAKKTIDLDPLGHAVANLTQYAKALDARAEELRNNPKSRTCYFNLLCFCRSRRSEIKHVNKAYLKFERAFLGNGLPGRPVYRHVIYAPGTWEGYAGFTFPSIREAIADEKWEEAREQIHLVAKLLQKAASRKSCMRSNE